MSSNGNKICPVCARLHCIWCGAEERPMTREHIPAKFSTGESEWPSIAWACASCNSARGHDDSGWEPYHKNQIAVVQVCSWKGTHWKLVYSDKGFKHSGLLVRFAEENMI